MRVHPPACHLHEPNELLRCPNPNRLDFRWKGTPNGASFDTRAEHMTGPSTQCRVPSTPVYNDPCAPLALHPTQQLKHLTRCKSRALKEVFSRLYFSLVKLPAIKDRGLQLRPGPPSGNCTPNSRHISFVCVGWVETRVVTHRPASRDATPTTNV